MIKLMRKWVLDFIAPGWDSPKPEIKIIIDYKYQTWRIDMESLRESKVVQAQVAACMEQSKERYSAASTSWRKNKSSDRSRRRRRAKSSRREYPTTMHEL